MTDGPVIEEYRRKLVTAEFVASLVKSGSRIAFTMGRESFSIGMAIAGRKDELHDVRVYVPTPGYDFGWYDDGWHDSFDVVTLMPTGVCQDAYDGRRTDYLLGTLFPHQQVTEFDGSDLLLTEVTPPDERGFCNFGASVWRKRQQIESVRKAGGIVAAEVNDRLIRPCGDGYVHVSEIDYFVEHQSRGGAPGSGSLAGRALKETGDELAAKIAGHIRGLINDGDTIQIGVGRTTEQLVKLGLLDGKQDIGIHSEATPPGIISLVKQGVINGRCKTINRGKAVVTSIGGSTREEMEWVDGNPLFRLVDSDYLEDVKVVSAHDNMVAINQALIVDLEGQIGAESIGWRRISISGGQTSFVIGALHSKGGKAITVIPSTAKAKDGTLVSRIVPRLPDGTRVTIPALCIDCVVTEYGVANMRGKTVRQRVEQLASVAHPNFREELSVQAHKLFWP